MFEFIDGKLIWKPTSANSIQNDDKNVEVCLLGEVELKFEVQTNTLTKGKLQCTLLKILPLPTFSTVDNSDINSEDNIISFEDDLNKRRKL